MAAIGFVLLFLMSVANTQWPLAGSERLVASTNGIAVLLFQDSLYIFCLQVVAVLLTAAVIGGVFLAKREVSTRPWRARDCDARALALADRRHGAAALPGHPSSASAASDNA